DIEPFTQYKEMPDRDKVKKIILTLEEYNNATRQERQKILKKYAHIVGKAKFHKETKAISKQTGKTEAVKDYMIENGKTHESLKKRLLKGPVELGSTASQQNVTTENQAPSAPSQDQGEQPKKKFLGLF
ncbi:MAG: hypothetical protein K2P90_02700, partial [Holosporales bacterium]|nr:hypothetical protein [Holosporales bacterium]